MVTGEGLIWDMLLEQSRLCYKGWGTSNGVFALSEIVLRNYTWKDNKTIALPRVSWISIERQEC